MVNAKRVGQALLLGCLLGSVSGCFRAQIYHDAAPLRETPDAELRQVSTLFASTELEEAAELRTVCPSGVSRVEVKQTAGDGAFHYLTLGMYSPQTLRVWCKR
jgi:hypothetical protein